VGPDVSGVFQYTPVTAIPASATGTWSVGAEARLVVQLATVDPILPKTVEEAAPNPVVTFTVDGSPPVARRTVVEDANCSACHGEFSKDFSVHGNLRNQTQYCVLCHNPNGSDVARRQKDSVAVAAGSPVTSIDFKVMIHKIHTGENLEQKPYVIYGFGLPPPAGAGYTINDFSDVRFPGDRRDCATCHVAGTYLLPPFPGDALGTLAAHLDPASGELVLDGHVGPIRAVCTSCHDGKDTVAHAETETASNGTEACTVCHEEGRDFSVSQVHAQRD
jgi:OmcA/MtrC family decaheme c-type cytochrome